VFPKVQQHFFLDHTVLITVGPDQLEVITVLPTLNSPDVDCCTFRLWVLKLSAHIIIHADTRTVTLFLVLGERDTLSDQGLWLRRS
jgi:hypothetical protein